VAVIDIEVFSIFAVWRLAANRATSMLISAHLFVFFGRDAVSFLKRAFPATLNAPNPFMMLLEFAEFAQSPIDVREIFGRASFSASWAQSGLRPSSLTLLFPCQSVAS
jgi:hypothetical protein